MENKRIYRIIFIISINFFFFNNNYAQVFQPEELKADVDSLMYYINTVHPEPYTYISKTEFEQKINELKIAIKDPITDAEFFLKVAPLVFAINDDHTGIGYNKTMNNKSDSCFAFPFDIKLDNNKIILKRSFGEYKKFENDEIKSINGIQSGSIISILNSFIPKYAEFNIEKRLIGLFEWIAPLIFNYPNSYEIILSRNGEEHKIFVDKIQKEPIPQENNLHNNKLYLKLVSNETAILKIPSFDLKRYMDFDTIFTQVKESGVDNLIIDVRENGGGFSWNVDTLLSYLVKEPFCEIDSSFSKISFMSTEWVNKDIKSGEGKQIGEYCYYSSHDTIMPSTRWNKFTGNIFVLINENSYSAATVFANTIISNSIGIGIGEETYQKTTFYANSNSVYLPNTKLPVPISSGKLILPHAKAGRGVIPNYIVVDTDDNLDVKSDAVLNFTLKLIQKGKI